MKTVASILLAAVSVSAVAQQQYYPAYTKRSGTNIAPIMQPQIVQQNGIVVLNPNPQIVPPSQPQAVQPQMSQPFKAPRAPDYLIDGRRRGSF